MKRLLPISTKIFLFFIVCLVLIVIYIFFPRSIASRIDGKIESIYIVEHNYLEGVATSEINPTTWDIHSPSDIADIMQILEDTHYHYSWKTFSNWLKQVTSTHNYTSPPTSNYGQLIILYTAENHYSLYCNGNGHLQIDNTLLAIDYWGNRNSSQLTESIHNVIFKEE